MEEVGDSGKESPGRPCPLGTVNTTEVFRCRGSRVSEREECNKNLRLPDPPEETILGKAFLGKRILRKHGRPGRREDS